MITNETYVGNETIVLTGNLLVLPGASLTLYNVILKMNASTSGEFKIHIVQGGTLDILDSNITAYVQDGDHNYGFVADPGSNLSIASSEIHYVGWNLDITEGYGIIIMTQNATIQDSNISHNYAGITIYRVAAPVKILNNIISWNQRNGITAIDSDFNLTGNRAGYNGLDMYPLWDPFAGHGLFISDASAGIIFDNDLHENYWDGLLIDLSRDITVSQNRILKNRWEGVEFWNSDNIVFDGNNASETVNFSGLSLWYSDLNRISNNTFFSNGNNGLYSYGSWGNDIINNTAIGSRRFHAFSIEESHQNNLEWNTGRSASRYGVWMGLSQGNMLIRNNFSSNGWGGVYMYGGLGDNSLLANDIFDNLGEGVLIEASPSNHLYGNNISRNVIGVRAFLSTDNLIIWNNFISNQLQAVEDFGFNYWDGGYPIGGNYWDDYGGPDFFHGPNQDKPGSDRIGDVPYVIDSDSQDNYPLTSPFDPTLPGPPTNVTATLTGTNLENVTISWNLSWNDRAGGTITNYAIYCGKVFDSGGTNYTFLSEIPAGNSSYTHLMRGHGDPNNYYYIVVANNTFGKTTKGGNQAGKFTRNLKTDINLLSYPLFLEDNKMESVLRTVEFNEVWYYEPSMPTSRWRSYSKSKSYQSPFEMDYRMSYWVNVTQESNLTVAGMVVPRSYLVLKPGWNLVGYPSVINRTSVQSLAGIPTKELEGFDGTASPYYLRTMGQNDEMVPGYGYWVNVDSATTWTVDNF